MAKESKERIKVGAPYSKEYLKKIFLGASIVAGVGMLGTANPVHAADLADLPAIVESVNRETTAPSLITSYNKEEAASANIKKEAALTPNKIEETKAQADQGQVVEAKSAQLEDKTQVVEAKSA